MQVEFTDDSNSNEWINWIEESISKQHIRYYEYKNFNDIQKIGIGYFGEVYRANWKNFNKYYALKSFFNLNNSTVKEIIHEVIIIKKYLSLLICRVYLIYNIV